jgi:hypothetical protein
MVNGDKKIKVQNGSKTSPTRYGFPPAKNSLTDGRIFNQSRPMGILSPIVDFN